MIKKSVWLLFAFLCVAIGIYPALYFIVDREFGLLSTKGVALLADTAWNAGFYTHILLGGLALMIGWTQFSGKFRLRYLATHRIIGKVYVVSVLLSALAGFYIAFYATGGWVASLGFMSLAAIWFYSTFMAYQHIRHQRIAAHERMMIYSYAACFAAVTLRIWLPLLVAMMGEFEPAYKIVAWLSWVPNILIANLFVKRVQ
jgi:uncharacterized membrane protein